MSCRLLMHGVVLGARRWSSRTAKNGVARHALRNIVETQCVDVDVDGLQGVCITEIEGRRRAIFVPGALPGAILRVAIDEDADDDRVASSKEKKRKKLMYGTIVEVLKEHDGKTEPRCEHFGTCGGCSLQEVAYEQQLQIKVARVRNAFERIAGLKGSHAALSGLQITGSPMAYNYRNRVEFSCREDRCLGKHRRGSKDIVEIRGCALQSEVADRCYASILEHGFGGLVDDVRVEYVTIRESASSGDVLVNVVTRTRADASLGPLAEHLSRSCPSLRGVVNSVLEGDSPVELRRVAAEYVVWGVGFVEERLGECVYKVSPNAFFQVNTAVAESLYRAVVDAAAVRPTDVVLDLYCGSGTIGLFLAKHSETPPARILGIEVADGSITDARHNAERNGVDCATFVRGDVGDVQRIAHGAGEGFARPDVIVCDPARAGLSKRALEGILSLEPRTLVYVSCNVSTQARDCKRLVESGQYAVDRVQCFDMYPMTTHVESVCTLKLQAND